MTDATVTPLRPPATKDVTGPLRSRRASSEEENGIAAGYCASCPIA
jgi:hypothetical protein